MFSATVFTHPPFLLWECNIGALFSVNFCTYLIYECMKINLRSLLQTNVPITDQKAFGMGDIYTVLASVQL